MRSLLIAAAIVVGIASCEDTFRYPCQSNANWNKPECQRPTCALTGTCPDQLVPAADFKPEDQK